MLKSKMDFLESTEIKNLRQGEFALENEPIAFQIQIHLGNAQHSREAMNIYSMATILDYTMDILSGRVEIETCLMNKTGAYFRLAQLIQHYGKDQVADYVKLVYGREVAK